MHHLRRSLLWLTLFSIAMGFLEASVVIYLRALYYPFGFQFPLVLLPDKMLAVELLREAATIIMLASIGIIAGRNTAQRFSFFIYSFAIWDIFYYVFLKLALDWPSSLFTWDILFLIPMPWVGPVIAPCIVSLTMIVLTLIIIFAAEKENHITITLTQWLLLITGALVLIVAFISDYLNYARGDLHSIWNPASAEKILFSVTHYVPESFNWILFGVSEVILLLGIFSINRSIQSAKKISSTRK